MSADERQASDLHGQPLDDAGRPARPRGDAAVLHDAVRQRGEPQPRVRLDGRGGGRERAQAGRGADRRRRQGDRLDVAARPRRTTSRSRAPRASTRSRATTSSPSRPSTRASSTPASASQREGFEVTYLAPAEGRPRHARRW